MFFGSQLIHLTQRVKTVIMPCEEGVVGGVTRDWVNILKEHLLALSEMTRLSAGAVSSESFRVSMTRRRFFLEFVQAMVLAVGLSMDAFAVSVCKGLSMKKADLKSGVICGAWFGGFQALMPAIGFFLGTLFAQAIESFDHWVAFGLLAFIGINMLREAFSKDCDCEGADADLSAKTMFVMAVATSIDAMAAGISLAMDDANILLSVLCIGMTTFVLSAVGVKVGNVFGSRIEKKAQLAGGIILVLLGLKILLEHMRILG